MKNLKITNFTKESESWNVIFVFSLVLIFSQGIAVIYLFKITLLEPIILYRSLLSFLAFISLILLLIFKKQWKIKYSMYIFFSLVIPLYFITWSSQATYALSGKIFTPFLPYKIYPIALAFLVPGPFWINLLTIILFYVQAIVFWFYFDMPGIDKVSLGSEPFGTIVFAVVAFLLLFFKYRDKQIITELGRKQANIEFYELLTQIFLSLRDKANTPLQIQKLAITVLKKRCPNEKGILDSLSNATDELESMNKILEHIEPKTLEYFRTNNLMDEEKILHSLELIEKEITDSLSNNMKEQKK